MKDEDITLRVDSELKDDFKKICDNEETTMSNKLHDFIKKEVKTKKDHCIEDQMEELLKILDWDNVKIINNYHYNNKNVSEFKFTEEKPFIDFLNNNKNKLIYLYLKGCSLPNKVRCFVTEHDTK